MPGRNRSHNQPSRVQYVPSVHQFTVTALSRTFLGATAFLQHLPCPSRHYGCCSRGQPCSHGHTHKQRKVLDALAKKDPPSFAKMWKLGQERGNIIPKAKMQWNPYGIHACMRMGQFLKYGPSVCGLKGPLPWRWVTTVEWLSQWCPKFWSSVRESGITYKCPIAEELLGFNIIKCKKKKLEPPMLNAKKKFFLKGSMSSCKTVEKELAEKTGWFLEEFSWGSALSCSRTVCVE